MSEMDDIADITMGVVAAALMMVICLWCSYTLKGLYEAPVREKTLVEVQNNTAYAYTSADILLTTVVNDKFITKPTKVIYQIRQANGPSYTVTDSYTIDYNDAWFKDKEASINRAYSAFFRNYMYTASGSLYRNWVWEYDSADDVWYCHWTRSAPIGG